MHSFPGPPQPPPARRVSIEIPANKRKPKLSNALFHPMDIAVNVNAPVQMDAKVVPSRRRSAKKKGALLKTALVNPLDVAVNVNTPQDANITLEAYRDYSRDIDPEKPRSRRHTTLKSSLAAPLNLAVNVNTPANVKVPINSVPIPRKRNSEVRPLPCDTRNMISSPIYNGNTHVERAEAPRAEVPERTPRADQDPLKTRVFTPNSIFALSGCSESSCSSRSEGSDTDQSAVGAPAAPKNNTLSSIKKGSMGRGSLKKQGRKQSIVAGTLFSAMDVAVQVNTPVDASKGAERIPASLHCTSLYNYTAEHDDELNLRVDDIVTIIEQSDEHWWIGKVGCNVGMIPANYVMQINDHRTWETVSAWNSNLTATEDERTRQEAIHELISTEKTYIDDLLLVVEVFYNPLCAVATEEELSSVFVNWQQLILCNARLFRALFNHSDINSFETVGAVFLEEIDSLTVPYTKFCSSQRQAMKALLEDTSAVFKQKEAECGSSPKVGKLPLSTFLLKPMQRITKYPLLIKKILSHTRDSHADYGPLQACLTRTEQLLTAVNEAVRATTRLESLQRVFVKCLSDDLSDRVVLNSNTKCLGPRKLIYFGSVCKAKGSKELFAVLFNDMLWVARVDKSKYGIAKTIDLDARDFDSIKFEQYREPFMLHDMILTNKTSDQPTIQFVYNDKPYTFHCGTPAECGAWTDYLSEGIGQAMLSYQSQHRSTLPDPTVTGVAALTLRIVEGLELSAPAEDKPTSVFVQGALHGHIQRTPVGSPKWDHTMHFIIQDATSDKINLTVYKSYTFSPNVSLGKFDLSVQKLLKSGLGPWNKRLILTDCQSGMVNVTISFRYHGNR